jgi:hypothetical protein
VTLDQLLDFFDAILPNVNHHQQFTFLNRIFEALQASVWRDKVKCGVWEVRSDQAASGC